MRSQAKSYDEQKREEEWSLTERITEKEWCAIVAALPNRTAARAKNGNTRKFIEAVMWMAQTEAIWAYLPSEYGLQHSVYIRFLRWTNEDKWGGVLQALKGKKKSGLKALIARYWSRKNAMETSKKLRKRHE